MSISPIRTAAVTLAAAGCVVGLAACHGSSGGGGGNNSVAPSASGTTVTVVGYAFKPQALTVKAGTKVTWKFADPVNHNVDFQQTPLKFISPDLENNKTYSYTFKTAGTYNYICGIHQYMTGTITVK